MNTPSSPTSLESNEAASTAGSPAPRATGCEAESPPSGNTGGKLWTYVDPESGEKLLICPTGKGGGFCTFVSLPADGVSPYSAFTDYLNCTFPFESKQHSLNEIFQDLFQVLGSKFGPATELRRGLHGYENSFKLGESSALVGIGGQRGTLLLSLPGDACSLISNWGEVVALLRGKYHARITRWDGAVDDYEGIHSVDQAVELYQANQFNTGGNRPKCNQRGNWIAPDGTGRTFYVGVRRNGKMIRIYEKGMELGGLWHPWVRWEIELHNKGREIPWDVVLKPGPHFVGSYPKALSWVQSEMCRIRTIQKQLKISYERLVQCASAAYGPLLNVVYQVEGSYEAAFNKLKRDGAPRRLVHPFFDKPSDPLK